MRANSRTRRFLRELRMAPDERAAARAERLAEDTLRRQRDNPEAAERRAAAIAAERARNYSSNSGIGPL
jgi:hypothetical protein